MHWIEIMQNVIQGIEMIVHLNQFCNLIEKVEGMVEGMVKRNFWIVFSVDL